MDDGQASQPLEACNYCAAQLLGKWQVFSRVFAARPLDYIAAPVIKTAAKLLDSLMWILARSRWKNRFAYVWKTCLVFIERQIKRAVGCRSNPSRNATLLMHSFGLSTVRVWRRCPPSPLLQLPTSASHQRHELVDRYTEHRTDYTKVKLEKIGIGKCHLYKVSINYFQSSDQFRCFDLMIIRCEDVIRLVEQQLVKSTYWSDH